MGQLPIRFDGADIVPPRDNPRLSGQLEKIKFLMGDGYWRSLSEISRVIGAPEASVSAQLRNLRKPRFGGYKIERKYVDNGLYLYRISK